MNLLSSAPIWPILDGIPASYPALDRSLACEVVVLGAGISGALCALHLVEAGFDVIVLDRRDVAHGSTAGSTSLLQYEIDEPLHALARRYGVESAVRAYRWSWNAIKAIEGIVRRLRIECGFQRKNSLLLASGVAHLPRLRREFLARREAGFDVEWWSHRRLASASTLPHPAAILSRQAGQIDAYRFTYGLLAAARKSGVRIFDRTQVRRVRRRTRGVDLLTDSGARVRARHMVVATGYEADALLPTRTTSLQSTYALASEPVADCRGWPADRCLIWETAQPYVYLRTTEDRRIILGGYDEPFKDSVARDRQLEAKTASLKRRFHQLFPHIPLVVATSWAGTFARTPDGLPFIGRHPAMPHTWFALGYGGNGITFSLIAAELIRDQLLGKGGAEFELFSFARLGSAASQLSPRALTAPTREKRKGPT